MVVAASICHVIMNPPENSLQEMAVTGADDTAKQPH